MKLTFVDNDDRIWLEFPEGLMFYRSSALECHIRELFEIYGAKLFAEARSRGEPIINERAISISAERDYGTYSVYDLLDLAKSECPTLCQTIQADMEQLLEAKDAASVEGATGETKVRHYELQGTMRPEKVQSWESTIERST